MLLSLLPPDSAEHVIRAVLSFTSSAILGLFVEEDGIADYNVFALFRLHGDVSGLARFAKTFTSMPGLEVRAVADCLHGTATSPGAREHHLCPDGDRRQVVSCCCALQAELGESLNFCELFVLGHFDDLVKTHIRETMFPALDKKRLVMALKRYRDVHSHFQAGRDLPGLQVLARAVTAAPAMCVLAQSITTDTACFCRPLSSGVPLMVSSRSSWPSLETLTSQTCLVGVPWMCHQAAHRRTDYQPARDVAVSRCLKLRFTSQASQE